MYDRIADIAHASIARYYPGYGDWRFSDIRSAQFATSGRQCIGGSSIRCSILRQGQNR
ncbi:hypothetical protein L861_21105 [Litchfieldella anticariensis FP35 = DSM 16096]|uniref:Uncharacterized protein n=1 Tax=Litchfieldella anticariensis (strain DSM 16096 / CECT 5854 / CIP 108499 / LMG 22089 / FP35) TaxID=1121939 RepID=S2KMM1_LITA3|nr:hypothetical protein L861_21105 [Halomonas anticariensis FP35 = DSM 16096]